MDGRTARSWSRAARTASGPRPRGRRARRPGLHLRRPHGGSQRRHHRSGPATTLARGARHLGDAGRRLSARPRRPCVGPRAVQHLLRLLRRRTHTEGPRGHRHPAEPAALRPARLRPPGHHRRDVPARPPVAAAAPARRPGGRGAARAPPRGPVPRPSERARTVPAPQPGRAGLHRRQLRPSPRGPPVPAPRGHRLRRGRLQPQPRGRRSTSPACSRGRSCGRSRTPRTSRSSTGLPWWPRSSRTPSRPPEGAPARREATAGTDGVRRRHVGPVPSAAFEPATARV